MALVEPGKAYGAEELAIVVIEKIIGGYLVRMPANGHHPEMQAIATNRYEAAKRASELIEGVLKLDANHNQEVR